MIGRDGTIATAVGYCACGCGERTRIASQTDSRSGDRKGQPRRFLNGHNLRLITGENHHFWVGDAVGYKGIHSWLTVHAEKQGVCEHCKRKTVTEWANVSGAYLRDVSDYIELCKKCHAAFDRRDD